ncbi:MAG: sugar ABC transporter substrate-binding protein [Eubacterium sp.]|nr:sugar ABC transporter substrate-binding protein [Eubacterium sp.]
MGRRLAAAVITILIIVSLAACAGINHLIEEQNSAPGSAEEESSLEKGGAGSTLALPELQIDENSPLYAENETGRKFRFGVIIEEMSPFVSQCADAAELFAEQHDDVTVQVFVCDNDVERELTAVETCIADGFDAIIMKPCDSVGCAPAVRYCREAGIPIVALNNNFSGEKADTYVGSDHTYSGILAARSMADALNGKGRIVILTGPMDQQAAMERVRGIHQVLDAFPEIEIADEENGDWEIEEALNLTTSWISSGESFDGIIACASQMAAGAGLALKADGRSPGEIPIASIDAMEMSLELFREGWVTSDVLQDSRGQGYSAAAAAYALVNSKEISSYINVPYVDVRKEEVDAYLSWYDESEIS